MKKRLAACAFVVCCLAYAGPLRSPRRTSNGPVSTTSITCRCSRSEVSGGSYTRRGGRSHGDRRRVSPAEPWSQQCKPPDDHILTIKIRTAIVNGKVNRGGKP